MINSKDTWNIANTITSKISVATESMSAPTGTFSVATIQQAAISALNGGTPLITGGGGGSFGNSTAFPIITIGSDGNVSISTQNVAGGSAQVVDSVTNTAIDYAAAANSVKTAYDAAVAAFTNASAWASANAATAYANAIAYSGNAALAYANAIAYVDGLAIAYRDVAQTITNIWTYSANQIPSTNGIYLGISTRRWQLFANGADFNSNVYIAGNLTVVGNLTINGTTTTFNSNTVAVDDPIFTLGGDTAPVADDNKDRGIEFNWHNGSVAKVGFFGFDDSTGEFTFIPDATNTSEVFSGTAGNVTFTKGTFTTLIGSIDATNVASGTLPEDRLTHANATTNGILQVLDSVVNTSILIAAAANSVKQAFDLATTAYAAANAAAAGGVLSFNTRTGAVTFANTDAESLNYLWSGLHIHSANINPSSNAIYLGNTTSRWTVVANTINISAASGPHISIDGAGPNYIRWLDNGATANAIDLIYRTTPKTLAFERTIDSANILRIEAQTKISTFFGNTNPNANGVFLGSTTARWNIFANTFTSSGNASITGATTINYGAAAANLTPALLLTEGGTYSMRFFPRLSGGAYNPIVATDDTTIWSSNGTANNGALTLTIWSQVSGGIRITSNNTATNVVIQSNSISFTGNTYFTSVPSATQSNSIGLAHIIPEAQNGAYTIALNDFNQMKRFVTGAAASWTIANVATVAYPLGFTWIARNYQANTLTVARGTGVTLRKAGSTTNTDVTISQWGFVSFTHEATDTWVASGTY